MEDLKIEYVPIGSIKPYKKNAKLHPQEQIEQIKESIKQFGNCDPIGIWKDEVVEGHGRLMALKEMGADVVPVIRLDHLTDEQRRAYALVHNKLTMNSPFDDGILSEELDNILDIDMSMFDFDDVFEPEPQTVIEDDFDEEPPAEPKAKRGNIYLLGNHRLMCGDSTSAEDVKCLLRGGKASLLFTDPPYGVDYKGIMNDDRKGLENLLDKVFSNMKDVSEEGASVYCFHSDRCADIFNEIFRKYCHFSSMIIWKKPRITLSQTDYQSIHEPCLYGWFNNGTHKFYGDRKQNSLWCYDRESVNEHTTPKPVALVAQAIKNSSQVGEIVVDPFGGSGSTLIACEQLNRKCYMMELSPAYVDVIIERWETFTGKKAVKL